MDIFERFIEANFTGRTPAQLEAFKPVFMAKLETVARMQRKRLTAESYNPEVRSLLLDAYLSAALTEGVFKPLTQPVFPALPPSVSSLVYEDPDQ